MFYYYATVVGGELSSRLGMPENSLALSIGLPKDAVKYFCFPNKLTALIKVDLERAERG